MTDATRGARRLARWMREHELTLEKAALAIGCNLSQVSRWRAGASKPAREMALAIAKATREWKRGPIEPREWGMR